MELQNISEYKFSFGKHKGKEVIWAAFEKKAELITAFKKLESARWSQTKGSWYVADTPQFRFAFGLAAKPLGKDAFVNIQPINRAALQRMEETILLKGLSPNTMKVYLCEFAQYLCVLKNHAAETITAERLRNYFLYCTTELKLNENRLRSRISAVKFYYEQVLHREKMFYDIPRPKRMLQLPKVMSVSDVKKIIDLTVNDKHKLMLKICYGLGLRVSEIVNLKVKDINSKRMQVLIEQSKGKKDRMVTLPDTLLVPLREYYVAYKPKKYLFEGQQGDVYSVRSAQLVFKQALQRANINFDLGIHSLRHSYATHLLEYGTDVTYIKELMGHNDLRTTMRYTHVSNKDLAKIKSPLDRM